MAGEERTEKPTAKRRGEARRKGQVARSQDLGGAGVLLAGIVALSAFAPAMAASMATTMRDSFAEIAHSHAVLTAAGLNGLFHDLMNAMLTTVAPVAGICVATGVLLNVAQVGLRPSMRSLKPDIKRISPVAGFKNIFGPRIAFETGKSLAKVATVAAVVAAALVPDITSVGANVGTDPSSLGRLMSSSAFGIAERAAIAYLAIGVIDYLYQRRKHEKGLKMTKQEVKDEFKNTALPPEVRAALRRRQMQAARARMMAAVPQADVVVTNPTHFAVALSYDGSNPAPVVVAKGQDHIALQIREIAAEHDVPIVPDPPLARELHRTVEIGQMIPADLYAAVAQVLAFVYRMAARKKVGV